MTKFSKLLRTNIGKDNLFFQIVAGAIFGVILGGGLGLLTGQNGALKVDGEFVGLNIEAGLYWGMVGVLIGTLLGPFNKVISGAFIFSLVFLFADTGEPELHPVFLLILSIGVGGFAGLVAELLFKPIDLKARRWGEDGFRQRGMIAGLIICPIIGAVTVGAIGMIVSVLTGGFVGSFFGGLLEKKWMEKSRSFDSDDEMIDQLLSAKDDAETETILNQMFDQMLKDNPNEFPDDELIPEEDLPNWLREGIEQDTPSKPLTEFNFSNDQWVQGSEKKQPLLIITLVIMLLAPILGILGWEFFDTGEIVFVISMAIFLVLLIMLITTGIIANNKKQKIISQIWETFSKKHHLSYEIYKSNRTFIGEYQGYFISADTQIIDVQKQELHTIITFLDLRIPQNIQLELSPYSIFDKIRRLFANGDNTGKGELEQRFKITTKPEHLIYVVSNSTMLSQRLLKILSQQTRINIVDKTLYYQLQTPPDKVENWQFLLNTLCILARTLERAES